MNTVGLDLQSFPAAGEYLSCVYLIQRDYGQVSNQRLAQWLKISNSAVTQAVGRLKKLGLVSQERYGTIQLSAHGHNLAKQMLHRHYLLEHLLVKTLDYPWDKADEEAHVLQNVISDDLATCLDQRLGHPDTCPHGNPMPDSPNEALILQAPRLIDAPIGSQVAIIRITEEGESVHDMLPWCQLHTIKPGAEFLVTGRNPGFLTLQSSHDPIIFLEVPEAKAAHIGVRWENSKG